MYITKFLRSQEESSGSSLCVIQDYLPHCGLRFCRRPSARGLLDFSCIVTCRVHEYIEYIHIYIYITYIFEIINQEYIDVVYRPMDVYHEVFFTCYFGRRSACAP